MGSITTIYYKKLLNNTDQKIYDDLMYKIMHYNPKIQINKPDCNLRDLITYIQNDIPLIFYMDYYASIPYFVSFTGMNLKIKYLFPKDEVKQLLDDCYKWGNYLINKMPANMSVQQQALWLHDVIIENVQYGNIDSFRAHSVIGVIKDKIAVCEGIARTYKFLCDMAGIPCIYLSGTLNGEPHGWNMIWAAGGTSFVDVTNDLKNGNSESTRRNFMRSSNEMHGYTWDGNIIPECNIRNKSDISVTVHDKKEIISHIRNIPKNGSISLFLDFGYKLSQNDMKKIINEIIFSQISFFNKEVSYSVEMQTIYIKG